MRTLLLLPAGALLAVVPIHAVIPSEQAEFFESKIRPVLAQDCYECHANATKQKGGLLLDSRAGWQAGGDSGAVIKAGDPAGSLLIQSIKHEHDDLKMPKNGAKLEDKVIADFEKWVAMGAPDPRDHPPSKEEVAKATDWNAILQTRKSWWSFLPVIDAPVPVVKNAAWSEHPVDRFILAKLEENGTQPAKPADPATIMRRIYYVLVGLPPRPEEINAFVKAATADEQGAINALVDRLLQSPSYGEKWARHWMDWVRYAETYGSEGDPAIPYAWRYRDYLIRALNQDVPYPQLVREAIAGDLLPNPRVNKELGINESALGIGQLRMVLHGFSPVDTLDEMVTFTDNQIDTVSKAFQSMTVSCARCHNHKFDPISQTDFYAMFGVFTSTHPAVIDVNTAEVGRTERGVLADLKTQIKTAVGREWMRVASKMPKQPAKEPVGKMGEVLKSWDLRKDRWNASGAGVAQGATKAGEFVVALEGDQAIARVHPSGVYTDLISTKDRGVLISPQFKCEGGTLWMRTAGGGGAKAKYVVQNYPRTGTIHKAKVFSSPADAALVWQKLDLDYWKGDEIFIQCTTVADMPAETQLDERSWFGITDVVITKEDQAPPAMAIAGDPVVAVEAWTKGAMTDSEALLLDSLVRSGKLPNDLKKLPDVAPLVAKYRELEARLPLPTRAPGVLEAEGHDAPLFVRGNHKQPDAIVPRRFLEAIDPTPFKTKGSGRLELAEHLADPRNPLTARVIVNRLWHHVFGRGIVASTDNFGRLGELPTHPELLDYLAHRFLENGGSIKDTLRLLVTSKTFRLDGRASGDASEKDPENKLLSHFSVRRLEAEAIRDSIVALSGKLDESMYGPSVEGRDPRRSVYVRVIRNALDPFLTVFDAPVPSGTRGRRDATNVPAQSLTLLNDPAVIQWSDSWAKQVLQNPSMNTDADRIHRMFMQAFGRPPTAEEQEKAAAYLTRIARDSAAVLRDLAEQEKRVGLLQEEIAGVLEPVRLRLMNERSGGKAGFLAKAPKPMAEWDFEDGGKDLLGRLPLELKGSAKFEQGALVVDGGGKSFAASGSLPKTLKEKTLEAWVMLDDLDQRGGGVMTVQGKDGVLFDSIVFAEKEAGCWVAGSNFFSRSELFEGPQEREAGRRPVHVAVVYQPDGTISGYRDGQPYGRTYRKADAATFEADKSQVLFGCRHGSGGGNKMLKGRIYRARLYDRALTADEVRLSSQVEGVALTEADVMAALDAATVQEVKAKQRELELASKVLLDLRDQTPSTSDSRMLAWASLAQSLINLKEFIYLK